MTHHNQHKKQTHIVLGHGVLAALAGRNEQVAYEGDRLHRYRGGLWETLGAEREKTWLSTVVQEGCDALGLTSRNALVNEVRGWIGRQTGLHREKIDWDSHGKIPTLSGLVDPMTGKATPLRPDHYATYRLECTYDPKAKCPWWERALKDCMPDRKTIEIVQEVVGAALITKRSREMTRALVLTGPSNTGKSGVIATIAGFLCEDPNTTPFDLLENNSHGTADFLRPVPWVLHEAFDAKWHFSATAKALLSGDPIQVNVKNGPLISHQFRQGVFWATNLPPQFKEQSRALEHRILIVRMHRTFDPEKPIGALLEAHKRGHRGIAEFVLAEERSGLLNWALAGLKRLRQRGYFLETKEMLDAKHEMHLEHNLAVAMVEDMVEFDSDCMVSVPNFCAAFTSWWRDNRGEKVPVADAIGRALRLLDERIGVDKKQLRGHSKRFYAGVRLNDDGLMAWQQYCTWGDGHIATDRDVNEVNIPIPRQWYGKDIIKRIRKAHGK